MGPPVTLFRFRITTELLKTPIDIRVALHPSETRIFMITRVIAFALNHQDGIEFGAGLAEPDAPAVRVIGPNGEILKWIDIGNPSARRLHKSAKAAKSVVIYTYKSMRQLKQEIEGEKIYNSHKIQVFTLNPDFLEELAETLERDNHWQIIPHLTENELEVTIGDEVYAGEFELHTL